MEISYANSTIRKICTEAKAAQKALTPKVAKVLEVRLQQMRDVENLEQLRYAAGAWHELTGDRKGTMACSLDGRMRLIFTPAPPRPLKSDGGLDWRQVTAVVNLEITDYH